MPHFLQAAKEKSHNALTLKAVRIFNIKHYVSLPSNYVAIRHYAGGGGYHNKNIILLLAI